jgi:predicted ATPase/DNA-binding CsgD family transcriptional regulator
VEACTAAVAGGYGSGVGVSSAVTGVGGLHGFPVVLTRFLGRAGPAGEVAGLLERHRLVTVTGPGGMGKTRLACEVAGVVSSRFADGAWLAELAPAGDPAKVPAVVAAALGVREQPGVPVAAAVARVLAGQQLLLVLDNCEHLIGAAAELCAGLLAACDDVRVLATSREPLRVAGEARYRLGPMSLPGECADEAESEAVALFADRARQADARFALAGAGGTAVARLVARLDGMPLAIELAAARVEALGAVELADRLDDRFGLLTAGDRAAAGRHQSLAAAVEWSYRLLDEGERRVFRQLSVFPGPFTLEAAEAVAGACAAPVVAHLVDCSLLVPPREGPDGRWRYGMLETLRAYGADLLAGGGELAAAEEALARWAGQVAGQAADGLESVEGELAAARRLDAEDATMAWALAWAMEHDADLAPRLVDGLGWWWSLRGRLAGQYPLLREIAGYAEPGSDGWWTVQRSLGWAAMLRADYAAALGYFTELRDVAAGRGPCPALADGLACVAVVLAQLGRYAEAMEEGRRALAVAREVAFPRAEVLALQNMSLILVSTGDLDQAIRLARQAVQVTARVPGLLARGASVALAWALTGTGDLAGARGTLETVLARSRDAGDLFNLIGVLSGLALLDLEAGRPRDAAANLRESVQLCTRSGDWGGFVEPLECCALLCAATGRPAEAVTLWAAAAACRQQQQVTDWPADARRREAPLRRARQALGPGQARAAEERGAAMSLETAAAYALLLTDPDPPQPPAQGPGKLSVRERELVILVAQGHTDAQIAAQLIISIRTVRSHLDRIRDKTGCRRRADLTRLALSAGLV